jgi:hypothetical protein
VVLVFAVDHDGKAEPGIHAGFSIQAVFHDGKEDPAIHGGLINEARPGRPP